jgi:anti-sigma factor RsiW
MTCAEAQDLIEAVASGDVPPDAAFTAHVSGCRACAASLALARGIQQVLADLPSPVAPAGLSQSVIAAVRRQRWRYEEHIDRAFNLTLGFGVLIVAVAIIGLLNVGSIAQLVLTAVDVLSDVPQGGVSWPGAGSLPTVTLMAAVAATAAGIWWWAERGSGMTQG